MIAGTIQRLRHSINPIDHNVGPRNHQLSAGEVLNAHVYHHQELSMLRKAGLDSKSVRLMNLGVSPEYPFPSGAASDIIQLPVKTPSNHGGKSFHQLSPG
jgi:hypothetical protein